ncbi:MAG: hypothetical protein JWP11_2935, partial [Frankiales bacterium]|nr:hypothetical protein [Frankiales bacterium]
MRTRFIMLCWLAAVVLLAWPVQMRVLGTDIG